MELEYRITPDESEDKFKSKKSVTFDPELGKRESSDATLPKKSESFFEREKKKVIVAILVVLIVLILMVILFSIKIFSKESTPTVCGDNCSLPATTEIKPDLPVDKETKETEIEVTGQLSFGNTSENKEIEKWTVTEESYKPLSSINIETN